MSGPPQQRGFKFVKAVSLQDIVSENIYDSQQWGINQLTCSSKSVYAHLKDGSLREFALPKLDHVKACPEWRSEGMAKLIVEQDTLYGLSEEAFSLFSLPKLLCTYSMDCDSEITNFVVLGDKLILCSLFDKPNDPSTSRALKILNSKTGQQLQSIRVEENEFGDHFYGITLQNKYFFGGLDRTIDVWDLEAFQRVKTLDLGDDAEPEHIAVSWASNNESFLFASCQSTLKIFELVEGQCIQNINLEDDESNSSQILSLITLSPSLLLVFGQDASFRILNVATRLWQQIYCHEKEVLANSVSFNGTHLFASVVSKGKSQILVWEFI